MMSHIMLLFARVWALWGDSLPGVWRRCVVGSEVLR